MTNRGETALVTGAASGIGRAVAIRLAARGAAVTLLDQNKSALMTTEHLLRASGHHVTSIVADVTDSAAVSKAVAAAADESGYINTLVCCAGILRSGAVADMPELEWQQVVDVNLIGTYLVVRHAIPMLHVRGGAIAVISSDAGIRGAAGYSAYCASKHALIGLVRCLALEYGPQGVRTNAICPSFVETAMLATAFAQGSPADRAAHARRNPLGRFASPDEVAAAVAHLTSADSSYVNGAIYSIDGGATAGIPA